MRAYLYEELRHNPWLVFPGQRSLKGATTPSVSVTVDMRPPATISFWLYLEETEDRDFRDLIITKGLVFSTMSIW